MESLRFEPNLIHRIPFVYIKSEGVDVCMCLVNVTISVGKKKNSRQNVPITIRDASLMQIVYLLFGVHSYKTK